MKIYIAHRQAERKWVQAQIVPMLERLGFQPLLVTDESGNPEEEAQMRWRLMDQCQAVLVLDTAHVMARDVTNHVEMGLMLGWARHIIVYSSAGGHPFAHLPWVINVEDSDLEEALIELRARLGESQHSHTE